MSLRIFQPIFEFIIKQKHINLLLLSYPLQYPLLN